MREHIAIRVSDQTLPPDFFIDTTSAPPFPAVTAAIVSRWSRPHAASGLRRGAHTGGLLRPENAQEAFR